ncbi:metallophosphoesterase [Larkinella rosea]|uniref:Phosphoesterase n=1 Tax=Larkinella rosea TaxID=2025312 RepID=A0A3P1BCF5_9BACT|nr:metallophosphoesterase [Larkinella rosea]RRA98704.1 phosphoesterase [Larkinella rosea]
MPKPFLWLLLFGLSLTANRAFSQTTSPLFTFGLMTDVQYCDCENAGTRHYRSSLRKLTEAVQTFNQQNVDFVVHLGDFIDHDVSSFDTLNALIKPLKSPLYQVLGNHDFSVKQEEIKKVPDILRLKNRYYTFARKQWRFIVLDGNDLSVYGQVNNSKSHQAATQKLVDLKARNAPNAQVWNGGLGEKQTRWLKKELDLAAKRNEKVLILCHFPLVPEKDQHTLWNDQEIRTLLENYPNVLAYLNGHVHVSSHLTHKGIHYVTFRGMVEQEDNGFAIVEIYPDYVKINGYAAETNRILKKDAGK